MVRINWDEFKEYKRGNSSEDKFGVLLGFMKSYYNMHSPFEIYDSLRDDDLAKMMMEKRDIKDPEDLENYLYNMR